MGFLEWATNPWGQSVPIHIAWFLIWLAVIAGLLFLIVHATYIRYFARAREFAGDVPPRVSARLPKLVPRHSLAARLFHWIMAASMFTLLFTAFLPKVGIQFPWVTYHWIAGAVLTVSILFHIVHASFFMDFWSIWPDQTDLEDAWKRVRRFVGMSRATAAQVCQVSPGEQALPRRHHLVRSGGDRYRRFHDVSRPHGLLPPESVSIRRHDLGPDVRAARAGGRGTDCAGNNARLLRTAAGEARDHESDDLRRDGPRLLSART